MAFWTRFQLISRHTYTHKSTIKLRQLFFYPYPSIRSLRELQFGASTSFGTDCKVGWLYFCYPSIHPSRPRDPLEGMVVGSFCSFQAAKPASQLQGLEDEHKVGWVLRIGMNDLQFPSFLRRSFPIVGVLLRYLCMAGRRWLVGRLVRSRCWLPFVNWVSGSYCFLEFFFSPFFLAVYGSFCWHLFFGWASFVRLPCTYGVECV